MSSGDVGTSSLENMIASSSLPLRIPLTLTITMGQKGAQFWKENIGKEKL